MQYGDIDLTQKWPVKQQNHKNQQLTVEEYVGDLGEYWFG